MIQVSSYESPLGAIIISTIDDVINDAIFAKKTHKVNANFAPVPTHIKKQLDEYFNGTLKNFKLKYEIESTPFRKKVYAAMEKIPYGTTQSYAQLAKAAGNPKAYRAVASACAQNPIVLFIPCHRVIGSDGTLHGYAAGLWRKEWLLKKEAGEK